MKEAPQPVIAAVHGYAIGAGLALAVAADLQIVTPDAKLQAPFTSLGLTAGHLVS